MLELMLQLNYQSVYVIIYIKAPLFLPNPLYILYNVQFLISFCCFVLLFLSNTYYTNNIYQISIEVIKKT